MVTMDREHRAKRNEATRTGHFAGDVDVTASEIAAYAYCAKAWHLERMAGAQPSPAASRARAVGTVRHERHGTDVRLGSWLGRNSRWAVPGLLVLAALLGALALVIG
jgi:hypothetical protein